ncbi:MAG: hypothetical protein ACKV2U_18940 [Bryobacteraceae bacterium]
MTRVIGKATLDQLRGRFFSDLAMRRFDVVLLARRHYQIVEKIIRTYAADNALRTLDAMQLSAALDLYHRGMASDLVSSDNELCRVAALEGLTALNPSENS